ncbi:MAG: ABC transporter ATP-binding protein [Lachnospiraceae bacterium]|nr:ABC transporter ATP-binding protein [Lachnospiraceae bacterium]
MAEKLLEIKDLYVQYHTDDATVCAVNGLDLSINKGETLGLVGETGAGKTTTCLSILKLLPDRVGEITKGSITYNGEDILAASEETMRAIRGKEISMIFQDPMSALNPVFTVGDQIGEVVKLHNPSFSNEDVIDRVESMFKMVGLPPERRTEYPHQFSGGMKQRIVIAMALACEPLLLLADEPTTALDVTIQAQVLRLMRQLKEKLQTAMILVTHDLGVVAQTCDKVAIMYAGEAIETGTVEDIFDGEDHHPYTVGLFGSIPDLTVETDRLTPIDGLMPDPANLPQGCKFSPRCPHCMDICKNESPRAYEKDGHIIRCHLFDNK